MAWRHQTPEARGPRGRLRHHAPPLLALAVVTLFSLWPAVVHFRTQALADRLDSAVFTWAWWSMPRAIGAGESPLRTDLMFHPVGADLSLTTTAPLVQVLSWPVRVALGAEAQINSVQLAAGFLAALGAYLLAHRVTGARGPALVAGVAFSLTSQRFVHVPGHFNLIHIGVVPFGCLLLLRLIDRPSLARATGLGALLGASFLVDPQLALFTAIALVPVAVAHRGVLREHLRALAAAAVVALLVSLPLLVPMVSAMSRGEMNEPHRTQVSLLYAASPLSWVLPPTTHPVLGDLVGERAPAPNIEGTVYPGLLVLGLAVVGARVLSRERRRGWAGVAATGVILSWGPYLVFYDTAIKIPLPFFALAQVPGLDSLRAPARLSVIGVLGLAVLAAAALAALEERHPRHRRILVGVALAVTVFELLPADLPTRRADVPSPFAEIAADPDPGAVLELPLQWYTGETVIGEDSSGPSDISFLLHAVTHEHPIVSGGVSRLPDERLDHLIAVPLYRQVMALQHEPGFDEAAQFDASDLRAMGISFVAYDRDRPLPDALAYFRSLRLPVLADDGRIIVWKVDP